MALQTGQFWQYQQGKPDFNIVDAIDENWHWVSILLRRPFFQNKEDAAPQYED